MWGPKVNEAMFRVYEAYAARCQGRRFGGPGESSATITLELVEDLIGAGLLAKGPNWPSEPIALDREATVPQEPTDAMAQAGREVVLREAELLHKFMTVDPRPLAAVVDVRAIYTAMVAARRKEPTSWPSASAPNASR